MLSLILNVILEDTFGFQWKQVEIFLEHYRQRCYDGEFYSVETEAIVSVSTNSDTELVSEQAWEVGNVYFSQIEEQGELGNNRLVSQRAAKHCKCRTLVPALNM